MIEHPILFKTEMIRAILDGRKTQSRRIVKPQPPANYLAESPRPLISSHYGTVGDRLWVKETWATICKVAAPYCECETDEERAALHSYEYRADTDNKYPGDWPEEEARGNDVAPKWKSSMFMPRKASRIDLEIVGIRVERLQDISPIDAFAEGVRENYLHQKPDWIDREAFHELWDKINARNGHGWNANPWVWVIEFKRVKP